jgi:hypothetical protein|nr:MAG TPA: hypothetical protein [Caudoviricetes sp.]
MNEKEVYKTFMELLEEAMNTAFELNINTWMSDERRLELERELSNKINFLKLYIEKHNMKNNINKEIWNKVFKEYWSDK